MEFQGLLRKLQEEYPGLIKNKVEIPEVIKKIEFSGILLLGLKICKGCDNNLKNEFLGNFS